MPTIDLNLSTQTPIGNFSQFDNMPTVFIDGYLYFVDIQKLSKILSLIKMLQNFNEFYSKSKNKNITLWLNNNGLVSLELLDEIKLYKIKPQGYNKFDAICQFFSTTNSYTNIDIAIQGLCDFVKTSIKNILLYRYFEENNYQLNDYIGNLILFLNAYPEYLKMHSLNFSLNSIIEMDKQKFNKYYDVLSCINLHIINPLKKTEEYLSINKISKHKFQECLKSGMNIHFKIELPNDMFKKIDKYLLLAEKITTDRINLYKNNIVSSNFCFLNPKQILYLNLFEENRLALNGKLKEFCKNQDDQELFYFDLKSGNNLAGFNYANINIISR